MRVVGPNLHDPRIHLAAVTMTIFVLGIGWLGFDLSIPQIVLTMLTCATIEVAWVYRRTAVLAWPASALQTATSTALLLRVIGTENGDYWSFRGWYIFVAVGAFALLTKYVIRFPGGGHVFNPSNIALVVAFLVLGSERVEPLDFWWAPFGVPMALAYLVIFAGGFWICGRLRLLGLGLALWLSLAAGMAVLAVTGHSMTARWSFTPISGWHFWWIVMTSPEIFIFLFFMITDPRTVPSGRTTRVVFGALLGGVCALLMAPWGTEFGVKVGLLSGLVVMCAARPLLERPFPARRAVGVATAGLLAVAIAVVASSTEGVDDPTPVEAAGSVAEIDPASLPTVTIDPDVGGLERGTVDAGRRPGAGRHAGVEPPGRGGGAGDRRRLAPPRRRPRPEAGGPGGGDRGRRTGRTVVPVRLAPPRRRVPRWPAERPERRPAGDGHGHRGRLRRRRAPRRLDRAVRSRQPSRCASSATVAG